MRKEMLCVLGVLLGGCWAQAQQTPYGYAAPAYYQGYPPMAQAIPYNAWPPANGGAGSYNNPANYVNAQYAPPNNGYGMNYAYAQTKFTPAGYVARSSTSLGLLENP